MFFSIIWKVSGNQTSDLIYFVIIPESDSWHQETRNSRRWVSIGSKSIYLYSSHFPRKFHFVLIRVENCRLLFSGRKMTFFGWFHETLTTITTTIFDVYCEMYIKLICLAQNCRCGKLSVSFSDREILNVLTSEQRLCGKTGFQEIKTPNKSFI